MDGSLFEEPRNFAVFLCTKVFDRSAPILHVSHDEDGDWQFLCNDDHSHDEVTQARLVCLEEALALDPGLEELWDLPLGFIAWRTDPAAPWQRQPRE